MADKWKSDQDEAGDGAGPTRRSAAWPTTTTSSTRPRICDEDEKTTKKERRF